MIANRNGPLSERDIPPFIDSSEAQSYIKHAHHAWKLQITIHELLGHGTGKLLTETGPAEYNFDINNPPMNPLTGKPITTWYRLGETWNSMFGDIAASLDECRAESVGSYLMTDKGLLAIFGFTDNSVITADDRAYPDIQRKQCHFLTAIAVIYNLYLQLGVLGLRSLESFIIDDSVS
jgi:dipeptidyl-peptidase-3